MPIRSSQTTVHRVFRQPDLSTVLVLECRSTIINGLLLQSEQAHFTLTLKLLQCMQFPHIANVVDALYDGTQESTKADLTCQCLTTSEQVQCTEAATSTRICYQNIENANLALATIAWSIQIADLCRLTTTKVSAHVAYYSKFQYQHCIAQDSSEAVV